MYCYTVSFLINKGEKWNKGYPLLIYVIMYINNYYFQQLPKCCHCQQAMKVDQKLTGALKTLKAITERTERAQLKLKHLEEAVEELKPPM